METKADLFTIMTFQILGSFWEKTVMPLVMTALSVGFSPRKVNDPNRTDAIANGQFILIKRSVYDAIGGHESVRDQIVEDKAISEQVKWNGYRLIVADGAGGSENAHVHIFVRDVGRLDEEYLSGPARPRFTLPGRIWRRCGDRAAFFRSGRFARPRLATEWRGRWQGLMCSNLWFFGDLCWRHGPVAQSMDISPGYALTTPLGAASSRR